MDRRAIEQRVREMYEAFAAGDEQAYEAAFSPDLVWHFPGDNPVSGAYRGAKEYFETLPARMAPLDEWHIEPTQVLVNERAMTVLVAFRGIGERHRVRIDMSGYHFLRLDPDGRRVVEAWGFVDDQDALDDFFRA